MQHKVTWHTWDTALEGVVSGWMCVGYDTPNPFVMALHDLMGSAWEAVEFTENGGCDRRDADTRMCAVEWKRGS